MTVTLTAEGARAFFDFALLDEAVKVKLVEEHRTKTSSYREFLVRQEKTMQRLLEKLRQADD